MAVDCFYFLLYQDLILFQAFKWNYIAFQSPLFLWCLVNDKWCLCKVYLISELGTCGILASYIIIKIIFLSFSINHFLQKQIVFVVLAQKKTIFRGGHLCFWIENNLFNRKIPQVPSSIYLYLAWSCRPKRQDSCRALCMHTAI